VSSLLSFRRRLTPPKCPVIHCPSSNGSPECLLCDLQLMVFLKILPDILSFLRRSCSSKSRSLIPLLLSWQVRCLECPSFRGSFCKIVPGPIVPSSLFDSRSCMSASLAPFHFCKAGHPSAGGGQLLPGPTSVLSPFLQLSVAPYSYMPVPIPLLYCSDSFHCGLFFRDRLMHRYRQYSPWGWSISETSYHMYE
jgi:hypothetical protein